MALNVNHQLCSWLIVFIDKNSRAGFQNKNFHLDRIRSKNFPTKESLRNFCSSCSVFSQELQVASSKGSCSIMCTLTLSVPLTPPSCKILLSCNGVSRPERSLCLARLEFIVPSDFSVYNYE